MNIYFYNRELSPFFHLAKYVVVVNKGAEIIQPGQVITWTQFRIGLEKEQRERKGE